MTMFDDTSSRAKQQFSDLVITYKNQSTFMRVLEKILFFNPDFATKYVTTIGTTIYFPSEEFITNGPVSSSVVLLHELVHVYDYKNSNKLWYSISYLIPQIFALLFLPLLILFGWKIAIFSLLFLAPWPAYFRMLYEKRGYTISAYALGKLAKQGYDIDWDQQKQFFISQFKGPSYYFMFPFNNIEQYFNNLIDECKAGNRPTEIEATLLDIIDKVFPN